MHRLINRSRSNAKTSEKSSKKKPKGTKFHVVGALVPPIAIESPILPDDLNSTGAQETDDVTTKVKTGEERSDDVPPKSKKATDDVTKKMKKVRGKSDDAAKIKIDKKEMDDVTRKVKKGTDDVTTKVKKEKKGTDDVTKKVKKDKKGTDDVTKKVKKNKKGDDVTRKENKKKKGKAEKNVEPKDGAKAPEVISRNEDETMTSQIYDEVAREDEYELADEKSDDDDLYEEPDRRDRPPMPRPSPTHSRTSSGGFHEMAGRVPRHAPLPTPPQSRKSSIEGLYESSDLGATAAVNPRTRPRQRRPTSGESFGRGEQTENRCPNQTQSRPSSEEGLYETTDLVLPYKGSRHNSNTSRPDSGDDIYETADRVFQNRNSTISIGQRSKSSVDEDIYETADLNPSIRRPRSNAAHLTGDEEGDIYNHLDSDQPTTTAPRYDTLNRELETLPTEAVYDSLANDKVTRGRGDVIAVSYEDVSIVRETRNDAVTASDDVSDLGELTLEPAAKDAEERHETIDPYDDVVSATDDVVSATDDVVPANADVSNQAKADLEKPIIVTKIRHDTTHPYDDVAPDCAVTSAASPTKSVAPDSISRDPKEENHAETRDQVQELFPAKKQPDSQSQLVRDRSQNITVSQATQFFKSNRGPKPEPPPKPSNRTKSEVVRRRGSGRIIKLRAHTAQATADERQGVTARINRFKGRPKGLLATAENQMHGIPSSQNFSRSPTNLPESELAKSPLFKTMKQKLNSL